MSKPKIIKPGTVVYDLDNHKYVVYRAGSASDADQAFCTDIYPKEGGDVESLKPYLTHVRPLNRKERGE